jgi:hypothetical protein
MTIDVIIPFENELALRKKEQIAAVVGLLRRLSDSNVKH